MRDDPRSQLDNLVILLKGRYVTTLELKGVLRELGEIARLHPQLAQEANAIAHALRERIRRKAV
jgi:hypothetical protein